MANKTDFNALSLICNKARVALGHEEDETIIALAYKGYYSTKQMTECHRNNVDILVSPKSEGSKSKDPSISKNKFTYDKKSDSYTCLKGRVLVRQGNIYKKKDGIPFTRYVAHWTDSQGCPLMDIYVSGGCKKSSRGRMINWCIYEDAMDHNDNEVAARKKEYKKEDKPLSNIPLEL